MAKFVKIFTDRNGQSVDSKQVAFRCPGCEMTHSISYEKNEFNNIAWQFNGDLEKPTVSPSIKVTWPMKGEERICHSYVRNGRIEFLSDCWHKLKGTTVDLPDFDSN